MELQWQLEVIEKWLETPGIPLDARSGFLEMLQDVNEEMAKLEGASSHFDETYEPAS
jgi:hypothetical protein